MANTTIASAGRDDERERRLSATFSHASTRGTRISEGAGWRACSVKCGPAEGGATARCPSPASSSSSSPSRRAYWRTKLLANTPRGSLSNRSSSMASRNLGEILSSREISSNSRLRLNLSRRNVSPMTVILVVFFRPLGFNILQRKTSKPELRGGGEKAARQRARQAAPPAPPLHSANTL